MLNKGFLGPIGDDLPSLIPLLFALLIFFGTFSFSFGVFNLQNVSFDVDLAVLNIARVLKGTSYVSGYQEFMQKCASINVSNVKYRAGLTNYFSAHDNYLAQYSNEPVRAYSIQFFKNESGQIFECPSFEIEGDPQDFFNEREVIVKIYPLVLEDNKIVKPVHLVVAAWQ